MSLSGPEKMAAELAETVGFTLKEGMAVMTALARGQGENGGKGFSDTDLGKAIEQVRLLRVHGVLAQMVLKGEMLMQIDGNGQTRYLTAPEFDPEVG